MKIPFQTAKNAKNILIYVILQGSMHVLETAVPTVVWIPSGLHNDNFGVITDSFNLIIGFDSCKINDGMEGDNNMFVV